MTPSHSNEPDSPSDDSPNPDQPIMADAGGEHDPERTTSKGSLLVVFLTVFIDLLGFGIVLPLLPLYADQFGSDPSGFMIGMLMASYSIMQFVFAPIWGSLSDRIGRRPVIIIGLTGSVVFYTLFGVATIYKSLTGLFITRIGAGIAGATIPTAQAYIADTTSNKNRARGMALIGMAFGLGFTLGPLFAYFAVPDVAADVIAATDSLATANVAATSSELMAKMGAGDPGPSPGFVAAAFSAVALLLAIFMLPESLRPDSKSASRKIFDVGAWKAVLNHRAVFYLLIGFFVCIFTFSKFETTLSMLIKGSADFDPNPFQFTFKQVCLTFAAIGLMVAIVQGGVVRRLAKVVPESKLAITGASIEIVGFGLIAYAVKLGSVPFLFLSLAVIVTGSSFLQPSLYSLLSRWTDPAQQGKVLGVGQSVSAMARIFGSALGIPMLKAFLYLPYIVGSVLMVVVAVLVAVASRQGRDFEAEE